MAEKLLENGADPKAKCKSGIFSYVGRVHTPLQFAVISKQYHAAKLLLKFHDPIEIQSIVPNMWPIIVDHHDIEMAKIFLDHGFKPDYFWIRFAIRADSPNWLKLFFDYEFEVEKIQTYYGKTAIEEALECGRMEMVRLFLQYT